ncbi:MAG: hypothetical protein HYZ00_02815, partial [Candidatus Hydrogenedentes bacterium]|nr:hypothetical protein [Candidatus Hydrogenedentota bacterium]
ALKETLAAFEEEEAAGGDDEGRLARAVLLVSDGEQVMGDTLGAAEELAGEAVLYVMGIGDPEGAEVTYPEWMLQYRRIQRPNEPHLSKLDEKTLSKIALKSPEGVYVRSTPDNSDVNHLHQEMETLRSHAVSGELRLHLVNRYRWPLTGAVVCFAAEGLWIVAMPNLRRWRLRRAG